jgi:hypothetical protein
MSSVPKQDEKRDPDNPKGSETTWRTWMDKYNLARVYVLSNQSTTALLDYFHDQQVKKGLVAHCVLYPHPNPNDDALQVWLRLHTNDLATTFFLATPKGLSIHRQDFLTPRWPWYRIFVYQLPYFWTAYLVNYSEVNVREARANIHQDLKERLGRETRTQHLVEMRGYAAAAYPYLRMARFDEWFVLSWAFRRKRKRVSLASSLYGFLPLPSPLLDMVASYAWERSSITDAEARRVLDALEPV